MMNNRQNDLGEVVLYKTEDGKTALDVRLAGETVWLTQAQIASLFGVNIPAVSKHVKNIFSSRELAPKATVSKMEIVRTEGKRRVKRDVEVYSLDMAARVGWGERRDCESIPVHPRLVGTYVHACQKNLHGVG